RIERRAGVAARIPKKHQHPAVGREGRAFVMKPFGQDALAGAIRLHDANSEIAAAELGKGDDVAARRPHRGRVVALAEADALGPLTVRAHDIDLLRSAAIAFEADARAIR